MWWGRAGSAVDAVRLEEEMPLHGDTAADGDDNHQFGADAVDTESDGVFGGECVNV